MNETNAMCIWCATRPRLAALSRCKKCLQDYVETDRKARQARLEAHAREPHAR